MKRVIFLFILSQVVVNTRLGFGQLPIAPNGKFVDANGIKIYYEEHGQGDPLFLLHGFGGTTDDWRPFIQEYSKNYRVIVWDMRGHGRSSTSDTSIVFKHEAAARDLLAMMDKLQLSKAKAIGHSSGGIVLLYAASMASDRFDAIIPVSSQLYFSKEVRDFIGKTGKPRVPNPEFDRRHGKDKGTLLGRQFYNFRNVYGDPSLTPDQIGKIKARTLIVHGDNDFVPVSQAWEIFQGIPKSHLWISPNTGHGPHYGPGNDTDFLRRTMEFLKGDKW
jgi:pimeloyl-ACP methyl ester carboxylesterase